MYKPTHAYHKAVVAAAAAAKSLQSCPTLCDPIDSSPPGSPVPGILKARTLEWVAISRDQIANIRWIIEKAREFQKNIYFCFIDYAKAFDCVDHNKLWKILKEMGIPDHLPLEKPICRSGSNSSNCTWNNRLVPNRKRITTRLYIVTLLI